MRVSAINNQQVYKTTEFKGKGKRVGCVVGGITGLLMSGAMIATCPVDWTKIKTWPIVITSLGAGGAMQGALIGKSFDDKKNNKD